MKTPLQSFLKTGNTVWICLLASLSLYGGIASATTDSSQKNIPNNTSTKQLTNLSDHLQAVPSPKVTQNSLSTRDHQPSSPSAPVSIEIRKPPTEPHNSSVFPEKNAQAEVQIPILHIDVVGSTLLTSEQIQQFTTPLIGKSATFSQLREVADRITQVYQDRGFITSRANIAPQEIKNGVVVIQVLEGSLERIEIKRAGNSESRLQENYIRDRIALGATTPLNFSRLEEALQLLRSDPLINDIRANLTAGSTPTQSVLQVTVVEAKSFSVRPFFDNYGNASTGIYRAGLTLQELNLTGNGDSIYGNYTRSGSADNYGLGYAYPISASGATIGFNFAAGQNPINEQPFDTLNIFTDSQTYELSYRQPLIRSTRNEFVIGASLSAENSSSFLSGRSFNFQNLRFDDGNSQARVLRLNQEYITRDPNGAWAFRSAFSFGLDLLGATIRNDGSPDGRFFYWTGQALRVQRIGTDRDTLALFRLNLQLTGDRLLSLNRFSIGGPQSVRGYRQSQLVGDNGIQGSVEFQFPVVRDAEGITLLKLLPFVEAGTIWNTRGTNTGSQTLLGLGLGAQYQPIRNFTIRVDYGIPLIDVGNPGKNLQDSGLYFSVSGSF